MPQSGRTRGEDKPLSNDAGGRGIDILTDALQAMGEEGITKQGALPVLIDFTTAIALIMGGEDFAEAAIVRIRDRVAEWKAGNFPPHSTETH